MRASLFGADRGEGAGLPAAGADHELADAVLRIGLAGRVLRRETLVVVVVPRQHDVRSGGVEGPPERVEGGVVAVRPRGEAGVMPVGERAGPGVGGEVVGQPAELRRARAAAADVGAVGVEDDDVPGAEVVAVPALGAVARRRSEVVEVAGGAGGLILVVARRRAQERLQPSPGRAERSLVGGERAVEILVVPQQEHGVEAGPTSRFEVSRIRQVAAVPLPPL